MEFFKSIVSFFQNLFKTAAPKTAKIAGLFIAANNQNKVRIILPYAKFALQSAKEGSLSKQQFEELLTKITLHIPDPKLKLILSEIDISALSIETGEVNQDVVAILEAFIIGLEAGA